MAGGIVVLLGNLNIDGVIFDGIAADFGWAVYRTDDFATLKTLSASENIFAVLFSATVLDLPWSDALEEVLKSAPRALPILCAGFSETVPWSDLADAGAFHLIQLPLDPGEAKISLGFVWAAKRGETVQTTPSGASRTDSPKRFAAGSVARP